MRGRRNLQHQLNGVAKTALALPNQRSHCLGRRIELFAARNERLKLAARLVEILPEQSQPIRVARVKIEEIGQMIGSVPEVAAAFELPSNDELLEFRCPLPQLDVLGFPRRLGQGAFSLQELLQSGHGTPLFVRANLAKPFWHSLGGTGRDRTWADALVLLP
jgi:hypothetical protein